MASDNRSIEMENWYFLYVEVTSKNFPSGIDGSRTIEKFNCIVAFPSAEPHRETIKNYLNCHFEINTEGNDIQALSLLSDISWCANALAIFYFREKYKPYLEANFDALKFIYDQPSTCPDYKNENMAIWVNADEPLKVDSEKSVAIYLRDVIRSGGKISVESAKRLIKEKFGSKYRLDEDVLYEFSKVGGKYTKKYLRL